RRDAAVDRGGEVARGIDLELDAFKPAAAVEHDEAGLDVAIAVVQALWIVDQLHPNARRHRLELAVEDELDLLFVAEGPVLAGAQRVARVAVRRMRPRPGWRAGA